MEIQARQGLNGTPRRIKVDLGVGRTIAGFLENYHTRQAVGMIDQSVDNALIGVLALAFLVYAGIVAYWCLRDLIPVALRMPILPQVLWAVFSFGVVLIPIVWVSFRRNFCGEGAHQFNFLCLILWLCAICCGAAAFVMAWGVYAP